MKREDLKEFNLSDEQVQKICKKALWLEHGHMRMLGDADAVCGEYMRA